MFKRWIVSGLVVLAVCTSTSLRAQSILEQLEDKVRSGLELNGSKPGDPPKNVIPDSATKPSGDSSELPPPGNRRTAPPTPSPGTTTPRPSTSVLEAPALPATPIMESEAANGQTGGTYLGLEAESLTGGGIGARVVSVTPNSPAWRAGFQANDVILAIDGFAITNLDSMVDRLALRRAGDTIKVLLLRNGRNVELNAVLQNVAVAQRIHGVNNSSIPSPLTPPGQAWLGLAVADLSNAFRTQFGLRAYRAAAVTNVTKGSPADALGIQPGDAIVGAEGRPIETARDLLDWMSTKRPGDFVSLNVMRGARASILETTLGTDPKFLPPAQPRTASSDPFPGQSLPNGAIELGSVSNTVPVPVEGDSTEVAQLRSELRAARQQLTTLEQRVIELENQLNKQPK